MLRACNFLVLVFLVSITEAMLPFSPTMDSYDLSRIKRDEPLINYRLPNNIIPTSYKIKINPDIDGKIFTFQGESEIRINVQKPTNKIILHAKDLKIAPDVNLKCSLGNSVTITSVNSVDNDTDFLEIILDQQLGKGSDCDLTLKYTGESSENSQGLYRVRYDTGNGDKKFLVSTHFKPIAARQAFPCWDEPALKANFTISIEHSDKYIALSNMHVARQEINPENSERVITHFAESPKMSTYLVAFVIGDFVMVNGTNKNFRVWATEKYLPKLDYAQEIGPKLMEALENFTNFPFKDHGFKKMDSVAVSLPSLITAAENWGIITYQHRGILVKNPTSISTIEYVTNIMAHELALQWFGNLVTSNWWNYIWLNDGFARYIEYVIIDQIQPSWRMMERIVIDIVQSHALWNDAKIFSRSMERRCEKPDILNTFNIDNYSKAIPIIRMISYILGEEKFKTGLRNYLKTKAFGSATSDDLFKEFAKVSSDNIDLPKVMKNWVTLPGYPVITVKRDYKTGKAIITQSRFLDNIKTNSSERYWIPINFVTEDNLDFTNTSITHWFNPSISSIEINDLKEDQFVIFNKQLFGYYRVNYDNQNWRLIINYLKNKNHSHIHVLNRAQLLDDAYNLAQVGHLDFEILLSLLEYLKEETDYIPWSTAWKIIGGIYYSIANTYVAPDFKDFVLKLSEKLEKEVLSIQYDEADLIMKRKRTEALKWTCNFGSSLCKSEATEKLLKWLHNPDMNVLLTDDRGRIMCAELSSDDQKLWKKVKPPNKVYAGFMNCRSNISFLENDIFQSITKNPKYTEFSWECRIVNSDIEHGVNVVLNFINNHFKEITNLKGYSIDKLKNDISMLAMKIRNKKQRDKLKTFIESNKVSLNGALDRALAYVDKELKIIDKKLHPFKEFFDKNVTKKSGNSTDSA